MVKAMVSDDANAYIEYMQDRIGENKADTVAHIIEEQARDWQQYDGVDDESV